MKKNMKWIIAAVVVVVLVVLAVVLFGNGNKDQQVSAPAVPTVAVTEAADPTQQPVADATAAPAADVTVVPADDAAVHGDGFAGQDPQEVTRPDLFGGDQFLPALCHTPALPGCKAEKLVQSPLCPVSGHVLQQLAQRHEEGDLTCRKDVADGDGGNHSHRDQQR